MPIGAELDGQREIGQCLADAPVTRFQNDDAFRLQLPCMVLHFGRKAAAVPLVIKRGVHNLPTPGALLITEMAHGGKEQCEPQSMLRNVAGFFRDLHLQDDILRLVEPVERRRMTVELITQHDDEMADLVRYRHGVAPPAPSH